MKRDLLKKIDSSFLSCEKDTEAILKKLFIENQPYSNLLKKLLVVNVKDCMDNPEYDKIAKETSIRDLMQGEYIRLQPRLKLKEHEEVKSYIIITFDNFVTTATNPKFRDCTVTFDIVCHTDEWDLGDYRQRPLKIAGIIDGILDNCKLSGIGTFQFLGCNELILNEDLTGYSLTFTAVHGSDDQIPGSEV